ncbi:MAG: hypothetical protein N4A38_00715 [Candidatus Gracilibacteria bacterium]|nr:hypothetical protein [Candidatus Gracilibacteria bacterium]
MGGGVSLLFYRIEILFFVISAGYAIYYASGKFSEIYKFTSSIFKKNKYIEQIKKQQKEEKKSNNKKEKSENINHKQYKKEVQELNELDKKKIKDLLKQIHLTKARGEYDIAKNYIIEALLIDKFNKEINIELASLYIIDGDFIKAEYIYKDLLLVHNDDFDILKKLGFVLSHQEKYDLAIEIYRKAHELNKQDLETINMLANLYFYRGDYINAEFFLKKFLKERPRHADNLLTLSETYEKMSNHRSAIITLKKLLEFEPYNEQAKEKLKILETPEIKETL